MCDGFRVQGQGFIEVELFQTMKVQLIQIVGHETYKPRQLSIFVKINDQDEYQNLGSAQFTLSQDYNARERKSLKINSIAKFIRVEFSSGSADDIVGITSLIVKGSKLDTTQEIERREIIQLDEKTEQRLQLQKQQLAKFDQVIQEFQQQLQIYVDEEDFEQAQKYQTCIQELSTLKKQYIDLQAKKLVCIQKQNYKTAQDVKVASELIYNIVNNPDKDLLRKILLHELNDQEQQEINNEIQNSLQDRPIHGNQELQNSLTQSIQQTSQRLNNSNKIHKTPARKVNSLDELDLNDENLDLSNLRGNIFKFTKEAEAEYQKQLKIQGDKIKAEEQQYKQQQQRGKQQQQSELIPMNQMSQRLINNVQMNKWEIENLIIENSKFPLEQFNYEKTMEKLCEAWNREDTKPPELKTIGEMTDLVYKLQEQIPGINTMIIRLLISKDLNHVRESIRFIDAALKTNEIKVEGVITAIKMVSINKNTSLFYCCQQLILRCYQVLLQQLFEQNNINIKSKVKYLDCKDQIYKQKDNVVLTAKMSFISNKKSIDFPSQSDDFIKNSLDLVKILLPRLQIQQSGPRNLALNILSTLISFPLFPVEQFFNLYLNLTKVNKQFFVENINEMKTNQKYSKEIEQRCIAISSLCQQAPWILSENVCNIIIKFYGQILPYSQKEAFRTSVLNMYDLLLQVPQLDLTKDIIKYINKAFNSKRIIKQFYSVLSKHDYRIEYIEGDEKNIKNQPRIVFQDINEQSQSKFPVNICQFCLQQVFDLNKIKTTSEATSLMKQHIALKCPCIGICPACKQAVETIYLPIHLADSLDCSGLQNYKYKLGNCQKCGMIIQQSSLHEHQLKCNKNLKNNEIMCNLCGEIIKEDDGALLHYSDNHCKQCIRTNKELMEQVNSRLK